MPGFIDVDFESLDRVVNDFTVVRAEMARGHLRMADEIGGIAAEEIRKEAPEGKTGKLKKSIHHRVFILGRLGGGSAIHVVSRKKYTGWVIEGRGWVRPVKEQVLHWTTEGGEDVFSMYARPTKPNPFHERGWKNAEPAIRARWQQYADSIAKKLAD